MPYTDCWGNILKKHQADETELALNAKSQCDPNSQYRYLQCMIQLAIYHILTNENLVIPLDPGSHAVYPPGMIDLQHAHLNQTFNNLKIALLT